MGRGGMLEPIPEVIGRKAGYTLDRSPVQRRADRQTDITPITLCRYFQSEALKAPAQTEKELNLSELVRLQPAPALLTTHLATTYPVTPCPLPGFGGASSHLSSV
ncbi:hypothetical protein AOLI_G00303280 [Acnodon oligacanthus]